MKLTAGEKLKLVKKYLADESSITEICKKYGIDKGGFKYLIHLYERYGDLPFTNDYQKRVYSREFKLKCIQRLTSENISARQIALEIGSPNPDIVNDWYLLFKRKGPDAVQDSTSRPKYALHADRQKYLAKNELNKRLEYLEAENEYLKKLYSLIQMKNQQSKKKS